MPMNFIQAMAVAHDRRPPGTPGKRSVRRAFQKWFVWYDPTPMLGGPQTFGFRYEAPGRDAIAYQPDPEDVQATDWVVNTGSDSLEGGN